MEQEHHEREQPAPAVEGQVEPGTADLFRRCSQVQSDPHLACLGCCDTAVQHTRGSSAADATGVASGFDGGAPRMGGGA